MNHASDPSTTIATPFADRMVTALHGLANELGTPLFAGLSSRASRRLSFACNGFADLIRLGEGSPAADMSLRSRACFLVSALSALSTDAGAPSLSEQDEAWVVAEVEADLGEATALLETRTGRPRSPVPPRPPLLFPALACA